MKIRLQQVLIGWLLVLAVGGHWPLLQSVAWVNMLVKYSQTDDFKTAVVKTFDGKHPCKICSIVAKGKETEQQRSTSTSHLKIDFYLVETEPFFIRPSSFGLTAFLPSSFSGFLAAPPSPPPKAA